MSGQLLNNFQTLVNGSVADADPDGVLLNIPPYTLPVTTALRISTGSLSSFSTTSIASFVLGRKEDDPLA